MKNKSLIKIILFVLAAVLCWSTFAGLFHTKPQQGSNSTNTNQTSDVPDNPPEEPELIIDPVFENNSWETIAKVFKSGRAYEYWNLGDIKEIELGDGYTYEVQIVDLTPNRYEFSDGSGYSNGVLQFVKCFATGYQMNSSATNFGGYSDCTLRIELNTTIYDLFPDDLKNVIPEVLIASGIGDSTQSGTSYSNNKLFLASEFEVFGSRIFSIGSLEGFRQFGYYDRNNSDSERIKISVNELSSAWWLRSSVSGYATHFCFVNADGTALCDYANASYGVCPCFAL